MGIIKFNGIKRWVQLLMLYVQTRIIKT